MSHTVVPAKPMPREHAERLEWALIELELAAPLPEPESWATTPIETIEIETRGEE